MPLPLDAQTRVAVLRDTVAQLTAKHQTRAVAPSGAPLFVKHADGSVYDTHGNELRGPLPKWPAKGK